MLNLTVLQYKAKSFLFVEGKENGNRFFLIKSGKVKTFREHDTEGTGFRDLGAGDFIGLVSCMAQVPQIESCMAQTDVSVISIQKDQFMELVRDNSSIAFKIIKMFSRRMRAMNETLTKLSYSSVVKDNTEHIFEVAQYYDGAGARDIAMFAYYQFLAKISAKGVQIDTTAKSYSEKVDTKKITTANDRYKALAAKSRAGHLNETDDEMRYYRSDTMIFTEGQGGIQMYIIIEGQVKITKIVDGQEVILAILKVGDMFGEMALLENLPRSANAIAIEDTLVMVVQQDNYKSMVNMQVKLIERVTKSFSKRIYLMYRKFDNVNLIDPAQRMVDMLAISIEEQVGTVTDKMPLQTELTFEELAGMCSIPEPMQAYAVASLQENPRITLRKGKIFIENCSEIIGQANFIHGQNDRLQKQLKNN